MLNLLGHSRACCDGVTRREVLRAGTLSLFGGWGLSQATTALPTARAAERPGRKPAQAKAVILIDLYGGPSHLDMFDPKPDAPVEIRGEFESISTALPGVALCEHLPNMAQWLDRTCLIRTLSHNYNSHNPYAVMTGFTGGVDTVDYFAKPTNHPSMGSICDYMGLGQRGVPPYVLLPAFPGYVQSLRRAGPYGGYLGSQYDPLFSTCNPQLTSPLKGPNDIYNDESWTIGNPELPSLASNFTADALDRRRSLLAQLDTQAEKLQESPDVRLMDFRQQQAFDMLLSDKVRHSFDLRQEPPELHDRYGRDLFGSSLLMARRLVERGVVFVTIHTEAAGNGHWDTHENNFNMLRKQLLPFVDRAVPTLLEDLHARGLLNSTLVVMMGDMGRSPRVNKKAGRDHWPQCGFCLLAGGGTKPGIVYGTSDKHAAYPKDVAVSPGDLVATILNQLGIDPRLTVEDFSGRPIHVAHGGEVINEILA